MTPALAATLSPASVAIVGASDNPDKVGGRPIHFMQRFGFRGAVYPINPGRDTVQGLTSYASLDALPEVPELAVIVVSGEAAVQAVRDCARLGVAAAIVIASGFGEVDAAGAAAQASMVACARAAGMRLVGPNSQGFANFATGAVASFSTMFIECPPEDGPIAIVSQSGAFSAAAYGMMRTAGLGVRHVHATGNEADVTVPAVADLIVDDVELGLILLYMEHIAQPDLLARAARKARARRLPMLAIKSGRTDRGQQMAASHTGSLAAEDRVVDAFLVRHGILRLRGLGEMSRLAPLIAAGLQATGRRLIAISNSGASCVMAADAAELHGLELAQPGPATVAALRKVLPVFATSVNPIDLTGALLSDSGLFGRVISVLADNPETDLVHIDIPVAGQGYDLEGFAAVSAKFARRTGKPVTISAWQASVAAPFRAAGLPVFDTIDDALSALSQLVDCTRLLDREPPQWPLTHNAAGEAAAAAAASLIDTLSSTNSGRFCNEADSLRVVAAAGLPVVHWQLCDTRDAVHAALTAIGGSVVLKACSARLPHKSEHGLVRLGLRDTEALDAAFDAHQRILQTLAIEPEGFIVAAMRAGRRELMLGARHDPAFGVVVLVGDGGKFVEAMPDTAVLLAPFGEADVIEALRGLRVWPVLAGARGDPPLDVQAYALAAVALARAVAAAGGRIASVDVNPIMVGQAGDGVWVTDALVEIDRPG